MTLICKECGDFKHPKEGCRTCESRKKVTELLGLPVDEQGPFTGHEEKIKEELKRLKKELDAGWNLQSGLDSALADILREKILKGGYLSRFRWVYRGKSLYPEDWDSPEVQGLNDLWTDNSPHTWFDIGLVERDRGWKKVALAYNDGELRLDFGDIEQILPFCEEYGLDVDFGPLKEKRERLIKELGQVDVIMEKFEVDISKLYPDKIITREFTDEGIEVIRKKLEIDGHIELDIGDGQTLVIKGVSEDDGEKQD